MMNLRIYGDRKFFYQWDTGQRMIVENADECTEVHFVNELSDYAISCKIEENGELRIVDVPDIILKADGTITAYIIYRTDDKEETRYAKSFLVCPRKRIFK